MSEARATFFIATLKLLYCYTGEMFWNNILKYFLSKIKFFSVLPCLPLNIRLTPKLCVNTISRIVVLYIKVWG